MQIVANGATPRGFTVVMGGNLNRAAYPMVLPTGGTEAVPVEFQTAAIPMPWPCGRTEYVVQMTAEPSGDAIEVLAYLDWLDEYRVCSLTHDMHILEALMPWSAPPLETESPAFALVDPGTAVYRIDGDSVPDELVVERWAP